jgi:hypothetical protein
MKEDQESGFWGEYCIICFSSFPMKILASEGAIVVPIAVPLNGEHIIQINGTAMGTTMAPSDANIFMGKLEKQIMQYSPQKPLSWSSFIDDIDMKWIDSKENLHCLFDHANNVHSTIKFTHKTSQTNIWTLTLPVKMVFDIYNKPTDEPQYLSPQSCHPKHCTKGIPYSQALRIKRICSIEQTTKKRLGDQKCHRKKRGYNNASINNCFSKASGIDRKDLIAWLYGIPLVQCFG